MKLKFRLLTFVISALLTCALNIQGTLAADPIFAQQARLTLGGAGGQAGDRFGNGVVKGNWAVFGMPYKDVATSQDQGVVYLYQRSGTTWTLAQTLIAGDGNAYDYFGRSIALSGTTLVIGADGVTGSNNRYDMGAAYVYTLSGSTWTLQQKLIPSDGQAHDSFGSSVTLNGSNILVGSPGEYFTDTHTPGAVYVYALTGANWGQQQKILAPDGVPGGSFGANLTASGVNLAVLASDNFWLNITQGAVYTFQQSGGWWYYQQKLTSPAPLNNGHYGSNLVMSGATLALRGDAITGVTTEKVHVYALSGSTWSLQQSVSTPDDYGIHFGSDIALENNRLVVGCDNDVILSSNQRGSAYVFERTGSLWNLRQKVIAPAGSASDLFGNGVSLSGDTILVGAPQTMINTLSNAGAAYLFTLQLGNSLPTVTPYGPYTIQSGSTVHNLPIASIADAETPAWSLLFDYDDDKFFTFANVQNTGGYVSASLTCGCGAATGALRAELNVIDASSAVGVAAITVTRTANTAPSIGRYPVTSVAAGGSVNVFPQVAPTDNGTFTIATSVAPAGFTGTLTVNQTNGVITISNAGPAGTSYTVTVTVTDNCNAVTTRTFPLTVL